MILTNADAAAIERRLQAERDRFVGCQNTEDTLRSVEVSLTLALREELAARGLRGQGITARVSRPCRHLREIRVYFYGADNSMIVHLEDYLEREGARR